MKDKYYMIDTKMIIKNIFEAERIMIANDFVNSYDLVDSMNADELFENLPEEYHKVIIFVPFSTEKNKLAYIANRNIPVIVTVKHFGKILNVRNVKESIFYKWLDQEKFSYNGPFVEISKEQKDLFYDSLKNSDLLDEYHKVINNLCDDRYIKENNKVRER